MEEPVSSAGPPTVLGPNGIRERKAPQTAAAGGSAASEPRKATTSASSTSRPADPPKPTPPPPRPAPSAKGATPSAKAAVPEPTGAAAPPEEPQETGQLPIPQGTVARISGLQSAAAASLNGELCSVLRLGDSNERVVVWTRFGEKALKPANLQVGRAVYPRGSGVVAAILSILSLVAMVDVLRSKGLNGLSAATVPVLVALLIFTTLGFSFHLHRPCKNRDSWVPAVSMLGSSVPARHVYRFGFISSGLLVALLVWLSGELVLSQLLEPLPPAVAEAREVESSDQEGHATVAQTEEETAEVQVEESPQEASHAEESHAKKEEEEEEDDPKHKGHEEEKEESSTEESQNSPNASTNRLAHWRNETMLMEWAPAAMTKWGYVSAAGLGAQGLFALQDKLCIQSLLHAAGFVAFATGALQHSMLTSAILASTPARALVEASPGLKQVQKVRRYITEFGPAALMMLVLLSHSKSFTRPNARNRAPVMSARSILQESGLGKSIAVVQWASLILMAVFYSTLAYDFWVGSQLAGQMLIEVDM